MTICSEGDVITPEHAYADILITAVMGLIIRVKPGIRKSQVSGISGIRELPKKLDSLVRNCKGIFVW